MRAQILGLLFLGFGINWGNAECVDSDGGKDPQKFGYVIYNLHESICIQDGRECAQSVVKERDRCLDSKTVLEQSCEKDRGQEQRVSCGQNQLCREGKCVGL